jgi:hypothetical protein
MYGVCTGGDVAYTFKSVQPVYDLVSLLFQSDSLPSKCKRPFLVDVAPLLLLRRSQGLPKRQVSVIGSRKIFSKGFTITIRESIKCIIQEIAAGRGFGSCPM